MERKNCWWLAEYAGHRGKLATMLILGDRSSPEDPNWAGCLNM
jgi:hypothetical protein